MAARAKPDLRVVKADEKPVRKPMTVSEAAKDGDRLDLLLAMRDRIAKTVQDADTPARDLAALTRRLMEIAKDIDVLRAADGEEDGDGGPVEDEAFDEAAI